MSKINETNYPRRPQSDYEDTDMLIIQEAGGNTYTTRIEDIREDCQETIAPTVEAVNDALAPPENGSTASQSYAIGEHFMRNGDFCTAIAAITSGASFTLNTNYVVGTIAEALESLNSDLTNVPNLIGTVTAQSGETYAQVLNRVGTMIANAGRSLRGNCVMLDDNSGYASCYIRTSYGPSYNVFSLFILGASTVNMYSATVGTTGSQLKAIVNGSATDLTNSAATAGEMFTVYG